MMQEFAEEYFTNTENMYVPKGRRGTRSVRYVIDRNDLLIKKVVETLSLTPRDGGGIMEAPTKYEDYRDVNVVKLPHLINTNNIIILKLQSLR